MFEKHHQRQAAEHYQAAQAQWRNEQDRLTAALAMARAGHGVETTDIQLKAGETLVYKIAGTGLVEIRKGQGHFVAGTSGVSVPVGLGVRARVGGARGHYVPGPELPTVIDQGTTYATTNRVLFTGVKKTVECRYDKLISIQAGGGHLQIAVSNRQKPTTISYGSALDTWVEVRANLALAMYKGKVSELVLTLEQHLAAHQAEKPTPPAGVASSDG